MVRWWMRFLFVLNVCGYDVIDCKICGTIDVRNTPDTLQALNNCRVIDGHLKILLMERPHDRMDFYNYRFPKLYEIKDYLLIYRIAFLSTLEWMFPNLYRISGRKLFKGYALVLHDLPHLEEVCQIFFLH